MSSVVTIPLDKNPEVADLLADMQPGDFVYARFTIKSKDDQTAQLRISKMSDSHEALEMDDEDDDDEEPTDDSDGDGSNDQERASARDLANGY